MHISRAGPKRRSTNEVRGAGHPGRARNDEHGIVPLVGVARSLRQPIRDILVSHHIDQGLAWVEPDVDDADLAAVFGSRAEQQARLQRHQRQRDVRVKRSPERFAGEAIDS